MSLELFNTHQEESKKRVEFLAKSIILISGGALSLSMTLFLGKEPMSIEVDLAKILRFGWYSLFGSMMGFILVFLIMIARDYIFGEKWRIELYGGEETEKNTPGIADASMWIIGIFSIGLFAAGMGSLAYVAGQLLP